MGDSRAIYGQIGKAVIVIMCLTVIDKLLAIAKEMLVAYYFGVSSILDTFNIALALPTVIILYFSAAFRGSFIPLYLEWSHRLSTERADDHALFMLYCSGLFFGLLTLIGYLFSPLIFPTIGYGLAAEEKVLGISIQRLLIFLLFLDGMGIVLENLLHAQKRFFTLYLSRTLINATSILFIVYGYQQGIYALIWGLLLGTLLKLIGMAGRLRRIGFRFFRRVSIDREKISELIILALPLLGSELIANSNAFIDIVMASQLPPGSVATLRYAYRTNDLPVQIIIIAMSQAIFPYISKQVLEKDHHGLRDIFSHSVTLLGFITFPIIALVMLFSTDIVAILYERGAFDAFATRQTAETLVFYNVGLFFCSYAFINGAFFLALKDTRPLLYLGCLSLILNILFNILFMNIFGVKGIALSTSVTLAIICTLFYILLRRKLQLLDFTETFYHLLRIFIAAACMYGVGLLLKQYFGSLQIGRVLCLALTTLPVVACYVLMAWILRIKEVRLGWQLVEKIFRKISIHCKRVGGQ